MIDNGGSYIFPSCKNVSKYGSHLVTCYDDHPEMGIFDFVCSRCGMETESDEMWNSPIHDQQGRYYPIKHCPFCGAAILDD